MLLHKSNEQFHASNLEIQRVSEFDFAVSLFATVLKPIAEEWEINLEGKAKANLPKFVRHA